MEKGKRVYETTFIVNASLDDPQVDAVITRVQETITKNGGAILALNRWGRKRLAYSINKKTNGFYANIEFEATAAVPAQLERFYLLDEMILRHLTIIVDKKAIAARSAAMAAAAAAQAAAEVQAAASPAPAAVPAREPLFPESGSERTT
jgi:small subunit ribosomal protein S6